MAVHRCMESVGCGPKGGPHRGSVHGPCSTAPPFLGTPLRGPLWGRASLELGTGPLSTLGSRAGRSPTRPGLVADSRLASRGSPPSSLGPIGVRHTAGPDGSRCATWRGPSPGCGWVFGRGERAFRGGTRGTSCGGTTAAPLSRFAPGALLPPTPPWVRETLRSLLLRKGYRGASFALRARRLASHALGAAARTPPDPRRTHCRVGAVLELPCAGLVHALAVGWTGCGCRGRWLGAVCPVPALCSLRSRLERQG